MIPGPIEFDPLVLSAMSTPATSHVDPGFINTFGESLELMRTVFLAPTAQPFVISGSGTLTWDMTASNLVEPGESVLVITTGVFGDWFAECFKVYGAKVTQITCDFGTVPDLAEIEKTLKNQKFKLVSLTHVDTSTGVLLDIKSVADLIKRVSPESLISVDGVCSVGGEVIKQEEWGIDVVMTASQKAIGVPPGLALMMVSQRALKVYENRLAPQTTYFGSFAKWKNIMNKYEARQPSYFATPPVQLIMALNLSLKQLVSQGMMKRFDKHAQVSNVVKDKLESWGLKLVPKSRSVAANTLTAVYYPDGIVPGNFLKAVSDRGVVLGMFVAFKTNSWWIASTP
jgi:alanine-glyoxylate transaminase/serine-glyoxylate transaminase/serine-pyruvate transaminase